MSVPGNGPKIPIPGTAGATIAAALKHLALHCGEGSVKITKQRVATGGYIYVVSNHTDPATGELERK